jgi:hypothetical protein
MEIFTEQNLWAAVLPKLEKNKFKEKQGHTARMII